MSRYNAVQAKQLRGNQNKYRRDIRENILSFIQNVELPCGTSDIAVHSGLSIYQARHYLLSLEKAGKIRRSPLRRGARTLWETTNKDKCASG